MNVKGYPNGWGYYVGTFGEFYLGWWKNGNFHGNGYSLGNKNCYHNNGKLIMQSSNNKKAKEGKQFIEPCECVNKHIPNN